MYDGGGIMYTMVIVDDEPWTIKGLAQSLDWEAYGFKIVNTTTKSTEAYEYILTNNPDVVFTDIRMPKISGLEMVARLREQGSASIFIVLTGFADFNYAQEALREGVFDYCVKPLDIDYLENLAGRIKNALDEKSGKNLDYALLPDVGNLQFQKLIKYINNHFTEELTINGLSEDFFINEKYCSALFKKHLGMTFSEYLRKLRIEYSTTLLQNPALTIKEIASMVGYHDYYYFMKVFNAYMGVTPAKYRKQAR